MTEKKEVKLKPSQALRSGVIGIKPLHGQYFQPSEFNGHSPEGNISDITAGCALGTMLIGACRLMGVDHDPRQFLFNKEVFGYSIYDEEIPWPPEITEEQPYRTASVWTVVDSLFENYNWSRKRIANYLASIGY